MNTAILPKPVELTPDACYSERHVFAYLSASRDPIDLEDFNRLLVRAGRIHGPAITAMAWWRRRISQETLAAVIGGVWSAAEYPEKALTRTDWRELFAAAGFTVDGEPAARPAEPVRLYRGSVHARRRRWSWTADLGIAKDFADGLHSRLPGQVYTTLAPPESLLAQENGREESEFVLDTKGLRITLLDGGAR